MIFLGFFLCFLDHYALIIFAAMQFVWISAKLQMINMPLSSFLFIYDELDIHVHVPVCLGSTMDL